MSGPELVAKVFQAGVVGAGGAGFPTHFKIKNRAEIVIANGAECEPLLQVDQQLLVRERRAVLRALQAVKEAVGATEAYLALKPKYKEAVSALEAVLPGYPGLTIKLLPDVYPAGDEQVLVYEVTGRVVPPGGIPLQVGVVVLNIETLVNVYAAMHDEPVTAKYLTVAGAVARPVTVQVPLGTPVEEVLDLAGGPQVEDFLVLDGGPMMGQSIAPEHDVVTKTTKGLLVLPTSHPLAAKKQLTLTRALGRTMAACCQCRECTDLCPRYLLGHSLEPHRTMRAVAYGITGDSRGITGAMLCSECGLCELFACTLELSPRQVNIAIKKELRRQGYRPGRPGQQPLVNPWRAGRQVPTGRLVARLGLGAYNRQAPLTLELYRPRLVRLPLQQGAGVAATPLVKSGDRVARGQLIATVPEEQIGANLHASIDGTVQAVGEAIIIRAGEVGED
ncbi:4Fe-4S dicluster domain-containing protein [Moorella naiadis (nom. illeg.)]|uniref:4Fe-4S dicluster domain-containing protein n=1 Tax=Moorella naiadis (nom. illeg.) TaxID=3093670 RepID=UPI003D9C8FA8